MSKILDLMEKRAKAWQAAKNYLDTKSKDGMLSAEDAEVYDRMETDVVNMGKEVARLKRQEDLDRELAMATSKPIVEKPQAPIDEDAPSGLASKQYAKAFWKVMRSKNPGHEVLNALTIGTDTEGGYLVPDEFEHTLVKALEENNIFRQLADVITTASGDKKIPVVASHGSASWLEEGASVPESNEVFGQVSIGAFKLGTMIKISDELLNDSAFNIESYIAEEFGRRVGTKEEEAFFVGDGTGKPTGIFDVASNAEVSVTANSATAITFDEAMDLYYSLRSPYRKKAVFVMNEATVKAFRKLKDGNGQYLWQPSLTAETPDTILNRPIYTSSYIPALAAGIKGIGFGDLSYYWVADRQGRSFHRLNELFAVNGQVGFMSTQRVDGKLVLPEAFKILQMKTA